MPRHRFRPFPQQLHKIGSMYTDKYFSTFERPNYKSVNNKKDNQAVDRSTNSVDLVSAALRVTNLKKEKKGKLDRRHAGEFDGWKSATIGAVHVHASFFISTPGSQSIVNIVITRETNGKRREKETKGKRKEKKKKRANNETTIVTEMLLTGIKRETANINRQIHAKRNRGGGEWNLTFYAKPFFSPCNS